MSTHDCMNWALALTMAKVLSSALIPYRPLPPPSAAGACCPSASQFQKAAPFTAPPVWALCRGGHSNRRQPQAHQCDGADGKG